MIQFLMGTKYIVIDLNTNCISINALNVDISCLEPFCVRYNGTTYISASQMLPWLNVSWKVEDYILYIIPDTVSFWTARDKAFLNDNLFDLNAEFGDDFWAKAGMISTVTFDTFINGRVSRFLKIYEDGTQYDLECYEDALLEMATDTTFSGDSVSHCLNGVLEMNSTFSDIEKALGLDEIDKDELQLNIVNFGYKMSDSGFDQDFVNRYSEFHRNWELFRETADTYSSLTKYVDILKFGKAYELMLYADTNYRSFLQWLEKNPTDKETLNLAVKKANARLEESRGAFLSYAMDVGEKFLDKSIKKVRETIIDELSAKDLMKDFGLYLSFSKVFYSTVFPVTDSFEEVSKIGAYIDIMNEAKDICYSLENKPMTVENLRLLRTAYIMALKASRKCYETLEKYCTIDLLGITLQDGDGMFAYATDPIDEKIAEFACSANVEEHDSIEGKEEDRFCLLQQLFTLNTFAQYIADSPVNGAQTGNGKIEAERHLYMPNYSLNDYPALQEILSSSEHMAYILADLTHDGTPELLLLINAGDGYNVFVWNTKEQLLYMTNVGVTLDVAYDLYLSFYDGDWYFLSRYAGAGTGWCWDSYQVYYLSEIGEQITFEWNNGIEYNYEEETLSPAENNRYYGELNLFFDRSVLVIGTAMEQGTELLTR